MYDIMKVLLKTITNSKNYEKINVYEQIFELSESNVTIT